ncbi:MAG TPA: hypothetical protein VMY77_08660 [Chitinophagaceae bacterium]|nr:hypothetical protein [Chitinophagaceae bacterium]
MKKILFICIVILLVSTQTNAQLRDTTFATNTHKVETDLLFQKAKKQKTAAWILLGGGAGLALTGVGIMVSDASYNASQDLGGALTTIFTLGFTTPAPITYRHSAAGPILAIAGTGAMLGSIPLFTASGKNKRNAKLVLKNESVFFTPRVIQQHVLSLGVKINL